MWILDPGADQDGKKLAVNNKCTPAISERYHQRSMYQHHEKVLSNKKGLPNVNVCAAEKNLKYEL